LALINYNQQDDSATFNVGCSGASAGATTLGRAMDATALGIGTATTDPDVGVTAACLIFDAPAPGASASWDDGDWVIRVNITTCDSGTILNAIHVCDFDGTSYTTVTSQVSAFGHTRGGTGVITATIAQGGAHTPQSATLSRPFIVIIFENNDAHGNGNVTVTTNQIVDSPIDDGVGGADPIFPPWPKPENIALRL